MGGLLPVHRVRVVGGPERCHAERERPSSQEKDPARSAGHGDQLVHIPDCVPLSHVRHHCRERRRLHPDRLLRIGHHLQVRCWPLDLPDHLRQVVQGRGQQLSGEVGRGPSCAGCAIRKFHRHHFDVVFLIERTSSRLEGCSCPSNHHPGLDFSSLHSSYPSAHCCSQHQPIVLHLGKDFEIK